jgi:catalase
LAKTSSEAWSNASEEDFTWARGFWEELPVNKGPEFADNIITNISISVAKTDKDLREKLYALLNRVATDLSDRVREATEKIVAEQEAKAGNGRTRQSQL